MNRGELHRLLAKVYRIHGKCSLNELSQLGITQGQPRILHHLSAHDGCIQRDFSRQFDLEPATVTNILSIMEGNGLIRREYDPEDRRVLRVFMTSKGRQAHERVEEIFASLEEECFKDFSDNDKKTAFIIMNRIYDNLKNLQKSRMA